MQQANRDFQNSTQESADNSQANQNNILNLFKVIQSKVQEFDTKLGANDSK